MACACEKCLRHSALLGLGRGAISRADLHKAYRKAAKAWHPDHFTQDATARLAAEEHFKQLQVAFRELVEHNPNGWDEPEPPEDLEPAPSPNRSTSAALAFGGVPRCYAGAQIPSRAVDVVYSLLSAQDSALALIDLSRRRAPEFSQFLILATHGLIQRNALQIISLLSYADIGELRLIDRRSDARTGWWQQVLWAVTDPGPLFALEIYQRDGVRFCAIENPIEDRAKVVLYRFLLDKKQQNQGA